jgi:hypothetical protein
MSTWESRRDGFSTFRLEDSSDGQASMILLEAFAAYAVAGTGIAVAFVVFGVSRVLPNVSITPGARLLLLPGAIAFWPLVLGRWAKSCRSR